jgi:D-xylose 1-dehydrogenase
MGRAIYPDHVNRSVLVTGGGSGIGEAITRGFARQKARIGFIDIADAPSRALTQELRAQGADITYVHADLTDTSAMVAAIDTIRAANGPITALINNAAHDERHETEQVTPAYFDERVAVNLKHAFFAAQAVLPDMKVGGGSIVNFSSISWMAGVGGMAIYTACKSAMLGLTRSLARDYGPFGIRVNAVAPGWIRTGRQEQLWITPEGEADMLRAQCLKRWLLPDEVANMVLFLASDDASACTAQHFVVDGGWV